MSDLRRDPLYNTLNEFDFIVFVQLETELFHTEFQVNVPIPSTLVRLVTVTRNGLLLIIFCKGGQ